MLFETFVVTLVVQLAVLAGLQIALAKITGRRPLTADEMYALCDSFKATRKSA